MALDRFYSGLNDVDLANDAIAEDSDLYIMKYEYIGDGVYANTTSGTSTLTPATSPSWTVNDYTSTVAKNLLVVDGNGKVCRGKITSNTAAAITFDETACLLEEDETTAGTFVAAATYSFYVLTPSSVTGNTYGPFLGYCEGAQISLTDEKMKYKYSTPRATKFTDLLERTGEISGGMVDINNADVIEAIFGAATYGSQVNQFSYGIGHNPNLNVFYHITFINNDRSGRQRTIIVPIMQFTLNGNIFEKSESGHHMLPWTGDIIAHPAYPETASMLLYKRANS